MANFLYCGRNLNFLWGLCSIYTGNFGHANNLVSSSTWDCPHTVNLHILESTSAPIQFFQSTKKNFFPSHQCCSWRILRSLLRNFIWLLIPKFPSQITSHWQKNEFLGNEEIQISKSNLDPCMLLLAKCVCSCLDPQIIPPSPYLHSMR